MVEPMSTTEFALSLGVYVISATALLLLAMWAPEFKFRYRLLWWGIMFGLMSSIIHLSLRLNHVIEY